MAHRPIYNVCDLEPRDPTIQKWGLRVKLLDPKQRNQPIQSIQTDEMQCTNVARVQYNVLYNKTGRLKIDSYDTVISWLEAFKRHVSLVVS